METKNEQYFPSTVELEVEFEEDDQFDNADDDITEEEITEAPHELTDVSEKLEKLFNIDTENKE